jgi:hypothetical protein
LGVFSITTSPITDWLYVVRPALFDFQIQTYQSLPAIMTISPEGSAEIFWEMSAYQAIATGDAINGFTITVGDVQVAIAQMITVATDGLGNLIIADPVRNLITSLEVTAGDQDSGSLDATIVADAGESPDAATDLDASTPVDASSSLDATSPDATIIDLDAGSNPDSATMVDAAFDLDAGIEITDAATGVDANPGPDASLPPDDLCVVFGINCDAGSPADGGP